MRVFIRVCLFVLVAFAATAPLRSQSVPRVQPGDFAYLGSFKVGGSGFEYGGSAIAHNPANNSLYIIGWNNGYASAEINIPAINGTASIRQPLADLFEGKRNQIGVNDNRVGGQLVYGGKLYATVYAYYDADYLQKATHFSRPLSLSASGQVVGPVQVSSKHSAGYYGGYMAPIPAEWQGAFGAPAVTGNCCIPILSRTSYGPALFSFNPTTMQATSDLVWYDGAHPLETYGAGGSHPTFNGSTWIAGVIFPAGTSSVLFFGRTGVGTYCYGDGQECGDPENAAKGEHAYPYRSYVWAYDANDLLAVKNGTRQPWSLRPYATWELPNVGSSVSGATYDAATRRVYVSQTNGDGPNPLIHVFQLNAGTTQSDTSAPTVSLTSPGSGSTISSTVKISATATDNVGVSSTWFTANGSPVGGEVTSAPFETTWNTSAVANGTYSVQAMARDTAGNVSASSAVSVRVQNAAAAPSDTVAPTVSIAAPLNGAQVSGTVTIRANASDSVGVASVVFTVNDQPIATLTNAPYELTGSTAGAPSGMHVIRAIARDAAGNVATSAPVSITINNTTTPPPPAADTTAPSVAISGPASGSTVSGTITVGASASDNVGVASVQFTLDGANLGAADTSAPYQATLNTTTIANGSHQLRAIARDAAGNIATSASVLVNVNNVTTPPPSKDTTAPTISLSSPRNMAIVSRTITLTASASDNVGVVDVRFLVDGVAIGTATGSPYRQSWNSASVSNGSHTITAVARDAAGNTKTTQVTVMVFNFGSSR